MGEVDPLPHQPGCLAVIAGQLFLDLLDFKQTVQFQQFPPVYWGYAGKRPALQCLIHERKDGGICLQRRIGYFLAPNHRLST